MKKLFLYSLPFITLSACTSVDTALPAGNNTFVISSESGPINTTKEDLFNQTLESANQTCALSGKTAQVISKDIANNPSLFGTNLKATITFKCQ